MVKGEKADLHSLIYTLVKSAVSLRYTLLLISGYGGAGIMTNNGIDNTSNCKKVNLVIFKRLTDNFMEHTLHLY